MELKEYLGILRRSWVSVVAFSLLGLMSATVFTVSVSPTYTAETQLFVSIQNSGSVSELQQGNTFSQARVKSYVEIAKTPAVLQPAIDALGMDITPAELLTKIQASGDLNTVLISISVEDESPAQAAAIAQGIGSSLISAVDVLERSSESGVSPVKLSVVTPAVAPTQASAPNTKRSLAVGLIIGLAAGFAVVMLRATLDTRVRGEEDLRGITKSPILGGIAYNADVAKRPLLTQSAPQSPRSESFRQIRTNLQFANINSKSKAMLVTSSMPGEGKSTTATNMAITMAQAGQRVVLIDGDLRRPTVAQYLGLEGETGLTTALIGTAEVDELLQPWGQDELYILTSGHVPPNPSELLGSEAMTNLIQKLETEFDVVIIDAPPLGPVTDATVLAQQVGGVVLVVGAAKTRTHDVERSIASLDLVGANILGIVLNLLPAKGPDAYAYNNYSYIASPEKRRPSRSRLHSPQADSRIAGVRLSRTKAKETNDASGSD